MIDRDAYRQPVAKSVSEFQQRRLAFSHRLHRIRQNESAETAGKDILEHSRQLGVHERLAAGKADQGGGETAVFDLVKDGAMCHSNQFE